MSTFKKCKVLLLPTNEKASLIYGNSLLNKLSYGELSPSHCSHYHLYIISDDKIEEGEFGINLYSTSIFQVVEVKQDGYNVKWITGGNIGNDIQFDSLALPKKIIATTDTSLTTCQCRKVGYHKLSCKQTYNLPEPSQSFIQKFIEEYNKGNVITDVMVEYETKVVGYEVGFTGDIDISAKVVKINSKDNTITIKKLKDSWNKCEHAANLIKYRQDYEQFKKDSHFGPNQKEIEEWSNKWIEENL